MKTRNSLNIALFIGSDISSHLLMNELVLHLIENGHEPSVYLPRHAPSKPNTLPELQAQVFFERILPTEYIYPFLERFPATGKPSCFSPSQLGKIHGITVEEIADVNSPDFLRCLKARKVQVGLSVRCYQKFGRNIIDFFKRGDGAYLWNLHPGMLPQYRGVMTLFRAMLDKQTQTSYSLHIINENWDDGPLIKLNPQPLDLSAAMLTNYCNLAASGASMVIDSINEIAENKIVASLPLIEEEKRYYTFPTRDEMNTFLEQGFRLVDPQYMKALFLAEFSVDGTKHKQKLARVIDDAVCEKY